jgi:hypothetical protein
MVQPNTARRHTLAGNTLRETTNPKIHKAGVLLPWIAEKCNEVKNVLGSNPESEVSSFLCASLCCSVSGYEKEHEREREKARIAGEVTSNRVCTINCEARTIAIFSLDLMFCCGVKGSCETIFSFLTCGGINLRQFPSSRVSFHMATYMNFVSFEALQILPTENRIFLRLKR